MGNSLDYRCNGSSKDGLVLVYSVKVSVLSVKTCTSYCLRLPGYRFLPSRPTLVVGRGRLPWYDGSQGRNIDSEVSLLRPK